MDSGNSTSEKSRLIIVATDLVSARITKTVEVDADVLSAPKVATDETGNYVIYVVGFEMGFIPGLTQVGPLRDSSTKSALISITYRQTREAVREERWRSLCPAAMVSKLL